MFNIKFLGGHMHGRVKAVEENYKEPLEFYKKVLFKYSFDEIDTSTTNDKHDSFRLPLSMLKKQDDTIFYYYLGDIGPLRLYILKGTRHEDYIRTIEKLKKKWSLQHINRQSTIISKTITATSSSMQAQGVGKPQPPLTPYNISP